MNFRGLRFFSRDSGGGLVLVSYHPPGCLTWHWSVSLLTRPVAVGVINRDPNRAGQWHDYYSIWPGVRLCISRQDYHKRRVEVAQ